MPFDLTVPIQRNDVTTFQLVQNFRILIRHKMRCILLTIPGERVMYPDFGAGVQRYLFENNANFPKHQLQSVVTSQITRYLPGVTIENFLVSSDPQFPNKITIRIEYSLASLNVSDLLVLTI